MISSLSRYILAPILHFRSQLAARPFLLFLCLLAANLARIISPNLNSELTRPTDLLFVAVVLIIGFALTGAKIPQKTRPVALCFLTLLGIYAVGLLLDYDYQGARHTFAILASAIIYLFCYTYESPLLRSRHILLAVAGVLAILLLYYTQVQPQIWASNPTVRRLHLTSTVMSGMLTCLILTIGTVLIYRSENHTRQRWWAYLIFAVIAIIGFLFGMRALAGLALLTFPMYWLLSRALRHRLIGGIALAASIAGCFFAVLLMGTASFDGIMVELDRLARGYMGGRILNGREMLWNKAVDGLEVSPWLGHGVDVTIVTLHVKTDYRSKTSLAYKPGVIARPVSRILGELGDRHTNYNTEPQSAHNLFLQIGIQTGLPGIAVLIALCLALAANLRSRQGEKVQPLQCYVATGTLMLIYLSMFEVFLLQNILSWGVFAWIFMGIGAGAVSNSARGKRRD